MRLELQSGRILAYVLLVLCLFVSPLSSQQLPEPKSEGEVQYKIEVPLNEDSTAPASPLTAVTIFPAGAEPDELQPVLVGPNGKRHAAELLWARNNEPIRVIFDTSQTFQSVPPSADHAIYLLSLIQEDRVNNRSTGTRRQGLTLSTKNFGPSVAESYDHSSLKAFTERWNKTPEVDGRSLVEKVQHGYPLHQPYGDTPRQYLPNMGAPLALHRYRGYFRVEPPDRSKIEEFRKEAKKKLKKVKELQAKQNNLQQEVRKAKQALQAAKKKKKQANNKKKRKKAQNQVENRKTALEEWQFRLKKLKKKTLPKAKREYEYADAAISEIQNNTYTFLTGSAGASWVLINGQEVAHWPVDKQLQKKGDKFYGYNEGAINLKPGIHKVEYLYASTGKKYLTFMLWRHPAEKKPDIMQPDMFGNVGEAEVTDARMGNGARPPAWELLKDSRISGVPDFVLVKFRVPGLSKKKKNADNLTYRWRFGDGSTGEGTQVKHLYLESGEYDVRLEAYKQPSDNEPQWSVRQPVRVHVPYDLKEYIKTAKLKKFIYDKDLSVYSVRHLLNALKAVEELDPNRLSYNRWRRNVLRELTRRADLLAEESVDWTIRAGEMSLGPTVALYDEAFRFFEAATNSMKTLSPRWHRTKLKEAQAELLVGDTEEKGLEALRKIEPNQHKVAPGNLMAWWSLSSKPYKESQVPDLSRNSQQGQLIGGSNAKIVEEETRSVLELSGNASLRLPIRPLTLNDRDGDGAEQVPLDGSGSSDDGSISSYRWTKDGTEIATGVTPGVNLDVGTHEITLTVTDNDGKTDTETIDITVGNTGILLYDFNEGTGSTAADRSGSNHDGALSGPRWSSSTPDGSSSSLQFDGSNDYVAISGLNYNSSGHSAVTVTGWVKTSDGSSQMLVSFDRSEYWRLEINGSGAGTGKVGWDLNTDAGQLDFGGTTRIDDGTWHHVAAVYDNGKATLYIDGQKDASTRKGKTFGSGTTRYGFVGTGSEASKFHGRHSPGNYLHGSMDDVRIYETALPQSRIRDLASSIESTSSSTGNNSSSAENDGSTTDGDSSGADDVSASDSDGDGETPDGDRGIPTARASLNRSAHSSFTLSFRLKLMESPGKNEVLIDDQNFTLSLEDGAPKIESRRDNFIERTKESLEPERWYNIILMRTAGKHMRLFVDGKEVMSKTIKDSQPYLRELRVGEGDMKFRLSDVRLYKGTLSRENLLELTVDRQWYRTRAEALLSAGRTEDARDVVEKWARITDRMIPPDPVRESATVQRIQSLIEKGSDQALLAAQEKINDLIRKTPRRLLSGEFNITILNLYLGRGANRVAANHAKRLLNLQFASTHEEKIMARRVKALARLGKREQARDAFEKLKEEYPYSDALRTARGVLERMKKDQ